MGGCELGGHGLAHDDGACLAQRLDAGRILVAAPAVVKRRAHLRRQIYSLDYVLDAKRHPIDWRERRSGPPALRRLIGEPARVRLIRLRREGENVILAGFYCGEATLQKITWRILSGCESDRGGGEGLRHDVLFSLCLDAHCEDRS